MKAANIRLAKTAGFCFGVNKAVNMVRDLLDEGKAGMHTRTDYS